MEFDNAVFHDLESFRREFAQNGYGKVFIFAWKSSKSILKGM